MQVWEGGGATVLGRAEVGSLWLVACTEGCLSQTDRGTEVQRQGATCPEPQVPRPLTKAVPPLGGLILGPHDRAESLNPIYL